MKFEGYTEDTKHLWVPQDMSVGQINQIVFLFFYRRRQKPISMTYFSLKNENNSRGIGKSFVHVPTFFFSIISTIFLFLKNN